MSVSYIVLPIGTIEELPEWLDSFGIACPSVVSRYPTPQEIRQVLGALEGYTTEYQISGASWTATVSTTIDPHHGSWSCLRGASFQGDENVPLEFSFEKGWSDLNLYITKKLSHLCGPLVLVGTNDATPVLVMPGLDTDQAIHARLVR